MIETPEGSFFFQDTSGRWGGVLGSIEPDVAILAAAGRANVDGEPIQGSLAAFLAEEAKSLGALRVLLAHHDDWLPGFASAPDPEPIRNAIKKGAPDVELLEPGYLAATRIFEGLRS